MSGRRRFIGLVGTGGIGSGRVFALHGNHSLGREESRGGRFLQRDDFCKLHIIAHYVRILSGPDFPVVPVGAVGVDAAGDLLLADMSAAGLDTTRVRRIAGVPTLSCICFIYPDGSGGTLTTDDAASSLVAAGEVIDAVRACASWGERGIALAVPEVPLESRIALLTEATACGFYRVASFVAEEMSEASVRAVLADVDLLAVNRAEAAALVGVAESESAATVAEEVTRWVGRHQPGLSVSVTAGSQGSWVIARGSAQHLPALPVAVEGTGGAGDAHCAGIVAGRAAGLPWSEAHRLGQLAGAFSVTGPHAIHRGLTRGALRALAGTLQVDLPPALRGFLET